MVAVRRRLSAPALAAVLCVSLAFAAPSGEAASCPGADLVPAVATLAAAKSATLCLLNAERAARDLGPLANQSQLDSAATKYSQAMVQERFFAHVSPAGETLQQRLSSYVSGAQTWDIGENLAWGEGAYATPAAIVDGWMHSDGHRGNILKASFREIGIGIVAGTPMGSAPENSATYTADFGSRVISGAADPAKAKHDPGRDRSVTSASTPALPESKPATSKPAAPKPAGKLSAAKKRWIRTHCATITRRTRSSRAARTARIERCVRERLRAAARA